MGESAPECPRCGYDLSGEIETWRDRCPLDGVCSECGYEVDWRDVLLPEWACVRGFFEHAKGRFQRLVWAWRTALWIARPPVFWRRVGLHHHGSGWGAIRWLVWCVLPLWLVSQTIYLTHLMYYVNNAVWMWPPATTFEQAAFDHLSRDVLLPVGRFGEPSHWRAMPNLWPLSIWPIAVSAVTAVHVGMLIVLVVAPETRRRARVRWAHLVRAFAFGLLWLVPLAVVRCVERVADLYRVMTSGRAPWFTQPHWNVSDWLDAWWPACFLGLLAWLTWWWWTTLRTGWQLRGAPAVLVAGLCVGALAAALTLIFHEQFVHRLAS